MNSKTRRPVDFRVSPISDFQARGGPFLEPFHRLHHIEGIRSMMMARKARGGKEVSPSSSSRAAKTRPRCMTTAFAHPAIQGGHRPCSATYFGACITGVHPVSSQTTQPRPAELACSISRGGSRNFTRCSSEALQVAYESGRRRPSELQTRRASRSDIARMLFSDKKAPQLDRPSWLELKGYVFPEGRGPNRGAPPHRFRLVWADILPWKSAN